MAEALLNWKGRGRFRAESAGSRPADRVNPHAIETLREYNIPWSGRAPRGIDGLEREPWDFVVTGESGAPLGGVSVVVVGTARSVLTNEKGLYHLSVPAGGHNVRARLIGYEPAEQRVVVPAGQTVTVDFKLTATPLSLNEVVV